MVEACSAALELIDVREELSAATLPRSETRAHVGTSLKCAGDDQLLHPTSPWRARLLIARWPAVVNSSQSKKHHRAFLRSKGQGLSFRLWIYPDKLFQHRLLGIAKPEDVNENTLLVYSACVLNVHVKRSLRRSSAPLFIH